MLSTGSFTPATYHIADDDIEAWRKLWDFACEYQAHDGSAPPKSLVLAKFPDFDIIEGISPDWAAIKVHEQAASRALRTRSKIMLSALEDGDLQGAYAALDGLAKPKSHRKPAADIFDHSILEDDFEVSKIEVPYRALQMATKGGIGPGELWYLAARYNQGKSWELMGYAAKAAQAGCKVVVVSHPRWSPGVLCFAWPGLSHLWWPTSTPPTSWPRRRPWTSSPAVPQGPSRCSTQATGRSTPPMP